MKRVEFHVSRRADGQIEVVIQTEFHESSGIARTAGDALLLAARTIAFDVSPALVRFIELHDPGAGPVEYRVLWK